MQSSFDLVYHSADLRHYFLNFLEHENTILIIGRFYSSMKPSFISYWQPTKSYGMVKIN